MSYDDAFGFPAKPVTDEQRNTVLAQIQAMNAELEAEAQMKRDAARWATLMEFAEGDDEIMNLVDEATQIIAFRSQVPFGEIAMMGQAPGAMIDAAIAAKQ